MQILKYRVENAQTYTQLIETTFEGAPATMSVDRALVECVPDDPAGRTFTMVLPVTALADFAEGATVTVTVEVES